METFVHLSLVLSICLATTQAFAADAIEDVPFVQEYHEPYPIEPGGPGDDVRAVAVDGAGTVWAATRGGVWALRKKLRRLSPSWLLIGRPGFPASHLR